MSRGRGRAFGAVALALCALAWTGCHKGMHNQPRYKPLAASTFWPDGQSARPITGGTVARGTLHLGDVRYSGLESGQPVPVMPVPLTPELVERGRERYSIFCAPCHGATGEGNGMIVRRGFPPPPSYHIDRLRAAPDGHFFDVITNGFGRMYSYSTRVPVEDRWAIVAYIRALQLSQHVSPDELTEPERQELMKASAQ